MKKLFRYHAIASVTAALGCAFASPAATKLRAEDPQEKQKVEVIVVQKKEGDKKAVDAESQVNVEVDVKGSEESPKLWLGILLKQVEGDLARYLGGGEGILVDAVYDESPAKDAGIEEGDILLEVNEVELTEPAALVEVLGDVEEGDAVELRVLRKGDRIKLSVKPAPRPEMKELELHLDKLGQMNLDLKELGEADDSIRRALGGLRARGDNEDLKVFRFGGPAFAWREAGDNEVEITEEIDGEEVRIEINRKKDEPAEIKITKNGETQTFNEEQIDEMSKSVSEIVKKYVGSDAEKLFRLEVIPQLEDLDIVIDREELAERAKEMAEKTRAAAQRAREEAEVLRSRVRRRASGSSEEVEKLKALVEELRAEVAELRSKLEDK